VNRNPVALTWDYRQQPDLDELARAVHEVSAGAVHIHQVDTGSDDCAIVVACISLTSDEVTAVWRGEAEEPPEGAKRCPRCGRMRLLGRYDVCRPCAVEEGWDTDA